jgi:phage N-6-adenine-methyltransferase
MREWSTPPAFFRLWDRLFHFDLDVCATARNAKCRSYYSKGALDRPWSGTCWMNAPYDRRLHHWVRKAYESSRAGATVVCLLPASTDSRWFHAYCVKGHVVFVRGRLTFSRRGRAGFASMVVVFHQAWRSCPVCRARIRSVGTGKE